MIGLEAGKDLLAIKAIKSSKDKIDRVVFHPVQPWVAYSDRNSAVTVWNYESNEVMGYIIMEKFA